MHISQTIGSIGDRRSIPTGTIGSIGPDQDKTIKLTKDEVLGCDIALSQYTDLMHPDFYAWYCKAFYKIGRERFQILAAQARADGKVPAKLFSHLIRKELQSVR